MNLRNSQPKFMKALRILFASFLTFSLVLPVSPWNVEASVLKWDTSGYLKSLNLFARTGGMTPEQVDAPAITAEAREDLFSTLTRLRLQLRAQLKLTETQNLKARIDYDQQATFGSFVASGDFRITKKQMEERQFLDLSQTLVEDEDGFYEHRLYRVSLSYQNEWFEVEIGRQQIPWGVGVFFTPTDLFNPFNATQIELEEREGVDAVNLTLTRLWDSKLQFVYTPQGGTLHPQRYLARLSRDFQGYEVGLVGGRIQSDHAIGFDFAGNLKDSSLRGEFLFREAEHEDNFIQFTVNADYNFPKNIYGLVEYHYNGQGHRQKSKYERLRQLRGDIRQLAKNYLAALLGHDITPLLRFENRAIYNLDDTSFFIRPELQYEWNENLLITLSSHLFLGASSDELGSPENLYFGEVKYSF